MQPLPPQMEVTPTGVAVLRIDCPGEKQNTLTSEMIGEFEGIVSRIETDPAINSVVLISSKKVAASRGLRTCLPTSRCRHRCSA